MFNYSMNTDDGHQYPASFKNPVSKGDEVYYKGTRYLVFRVIHSADGSGSTIECDRM